ncbi:LysR family transcriptional regulator [Streptomyces sp. TS71-3]|uniref:LysR family transcriptional regulator n=1 Tax=Streptomyces sp. TS71-3 TaxID=2733862 RepID=UPI001B249EDF|nr:LysR family transcriptional regulator [Streptomyces sp. TS71-3]GHJ42400.1 LysR family transcriptional regulator [Streptomyces sp. TS71-3]
MLLRQLEYLTALARERHFARAAAACFVSQPSLSAGIRRLEAELGVAIVRRGQRFEGFTPEGERVLSWAHRILAECDGMRQELSELRGGLTGVLRLGAIPTALTVASLLTTPFCARHPHARVSLVESLSSRDIVRMLSNCDIDAAMTYIDDDTLRHVHRIPLYEERYVLLTPGDGPLAGAERARWAEVAEVPLCLLAQRMRNRRIMDECFGADGATARPAIETDTVAGLYAHLAGGRWSSVISHAWLHMFGVPQGMRVVPLTGPVQGARVGLVTDDRGPEPALTRALFSVAREAGVREALDDLLHTHLTAPGPAPAPGPVGPATPLPAPVAGVSGASGGR